jgi:hypothetical protein
MVGHAGEIIQIVRARTIAPAAYDWRRVPSGLLSAVAAVNHAPKYSRICSNSRGLAVQWRAWHGAYSVKVLLWVMSAPTNAGRGRVSSASLPHSGQVTGNWIVASLMAYQSQVCERRFQIFARSDSQIKDEILARSRGRFRDSLAFALRAATAQA